MFHFTNCYGILSCIPFWAGVWSSFSARAWRKEKKKDEIMMRLYWKAVDAGLCAAELHDAAYSLLREALAADWNVSVAVIEKTPHGKPFLAGERMPHISVSHTKGLVCCAVSEKPVGVDCEYRRGVSEGVRQRVCTENELRDIRQAEDPEGRFLAYWTLKESISKKRGVGLGESFRAYEIRFEDEVPLCESHVLTFRNIDGFFVSTAE